MAIDTCPIVSSEVHRTEKAALRQIVEAAGLNRWSACPVDLRRNYLGGSAVSQGITYPITLLSGKQFGEWVDDNRVSTFHLDLLCRAADCDRLNPHWAFSTFVDLRRSFPLLRKLESRSLVVVSVVEQTPYRPFLMTSLPLNHQTKQKGAVTLTNDENLNQLKRKSDSSPLFLPNKKTFSCAEDTGLIPFANWSETENTLTDGTKNIKNVGLYTGFMFDEPEGCTEYIEGGSTPWSRPHYNQEEVFTAVHNDGENSLLISRATAFIVNYIDVAKPSTCIDCDIPGVSVTIPVSRRDGRPLSVITDSWSNLHVRSSFSPWLRAVCVWSPYVVNNASKELILPTIHVGDVEAWVIDSGVSKQAVKPNAIVEPEQKAVSSSSTASKRKKGGRQRDERRDNDRMEALCDALCRHHGFDRGVFLARCKRSDAISAKELMLKANSKLDEEDKFPLTGGSFLSERLWPLLALSESNVEGVSAWQAGYEEFRDYRSSGDNVVRKKKTKHDYNALCTEARLGELDLWLRGLSELCSRLVSPTPLKGDPNSEDYISDLSTSGPGSDA